MTEIVPSYLRYRRESESEMTDQSDDRDAKAWSEVRVDLIRWLRSRAAEHDRIAGLGGQDDAEVQRLLAEMGHPTYAQQAIAERALAEQIEALTLPGNLSAQGQPSMTSSST